MRRIGKICGLFAGGILLIAMLAVVYLTVQVEKGRRQADREYAGAGPFARLSPFGSVRRLSILPLSEKRAGSARYRTEPGVSYLIRADNTTILMDLGLNAGGTHPSPLLDNMRALGVDPSRIDFLFISHLHPDHTGTGWAAGVRDFRVSEGPVALPAVTAYAPGPVSPSHWNPAPRVEVMRGPRVLAPGIAAIGPIPRCLFLFGRVDENALAVHLQGKGIVLFSGCGHQGVPRLLERAQALFVEPVYGLVGGLHLPARGSGRDLLSEVIITDRFPLPGAGARRAMHAIDALEKLNPGYVAVSPHDSTDWTIERFRERFGARYHDLEVGRELTL